MQTWDAFRARRNVRRYQDVKIEHDKIDLILEAARRTPSSMNGQPWDFVVCTEPQVLQKLAETWKYARHVAGSAMTVALVAPEPADQDERDWFFYDMGQATMSMMLMGADLGIGSSHAAVDDQETARETLGIPDGKLVVGLIAFGYPDGEPIKPLSKPNRRPFEEVVHREHW
jgi:nitroreductase